MLPTLSLYHPPHTLALALPLALPLPLPLLGLDPMMESPSALTYTRADLNDILMLVKDGDMKGGVPKYAAGGQIGTQADEELDGNNASICCSHVQRLSLRILYCMCVAGAAFVSS